MNKNYIYHKSIYHYTLLAICHCIGGMYSVENYFLASNYYNAKTGSNVFNKLKLLQKQAIKGKKTEKF